MKRKGAKLGINYCLIVEVKCSFEIFELETDVCCEDDKQTKKSELIIIDCFIHEAIDPFIKANLRLRMESRLLC